MPIPNADSGDVCSAPRQTSTCRPSKRVLVVDDDGDVRESLKTILNAHGYEASLACDGSEGLKRAERDAPDLIILDVMMPRRSGFVVLERIHTWPGNRPQVIMVSAHDDARYRAFAAAHGAKAFFTKPFALEELVAEVDRLLTPAEIPFEARFAASESAPVLSERPLSDEVAAAPQPFQK